MRQRLIEGDWSSLGQAASVVRSAVFVAEQGVPAELELDEFDTHSWHVLALDEAGAPVATGRLLADGHIGRLAVLPAWRGQGLGRQIMQRLMQRAQERRLPCVRVNAQLAAMAFYEGLGFVAEGEVFTEAGIAHQSMCKALSGA